MVFQRTKPSMPTIALTGVRMMLIALKMMLTKVKRRPMMRKAWVALSIELRTMKGAGSVVFPNVVENLWMNLLATHFTKKITLVAWFADHGGMVCNRNHPCETSCCCPIAESVFFVILMFVPSSC